MLTEKNYEKIVELLKVCDNTVPDILDKLSELIQNNIYCEYCPIEEKCYLQMEKDNRLYFEEGCCNRIFDYILKDEL